MAGLAFSLIPWLCIPVFFCLPISMTSPFFSQRPCQPLGFMEGNSTANLPAPCPSVHPETSASLPKALKTTILQQKQSNGAFLILTASAFPHYLPLGAITVSFWNHRRLAGLCPSQSWYISSHHPPEQPKPLPLSSDWHCLAASPLALSLGTIQAPAAPTYLPLWSFLHIAMKSSLPTAKLITSHNGSQGCQFFVTYMGTKV